jgi:multidrug efflux pump subunit AcrA (membrane-fusion protein)
VPRDSRYPGSPALSCRTGSVDAVRAASALAGRPRRGSKRWIRRALALGLLGLVFVLGCSPVLPEPRVPARPSVPGPSAPNVPQRQARATPGVEQRTAVASGDVVEAGQAYVAALYAADDDTAALYMPGYGSVLRKDEDHYELQNLSARPMSWGEAGYADADPSLEFAEVIAQVRARDGSSAGRVYYKIGFKRNGDGLSIDLASRRLDVREGRGG